MVNLPFVNCGVAPKKIREGKRLVTSRHQRCEQNKRTKLLCGLNRVRGRRGVKEKGSSRTATPLIIIIVSLLNDQIWT